MSIPDTIMKVLNEHIKYKEEINKLSKEDFEKVILLVDSCGEYSDYEKEEIKQLLKVTYKN